MSQIIECRAAASQLKKSVQTITNSEFRDYSKATAKEYRLDINDRDGLFFYCQRKQEEKVV